MDPYKLLRISLNSDGSLARSEPFPRSPPSAAAAGYSVLSHDFPLYPPRRTTIRAFIPADQTTGGSSRPLPVIFYFHGGGFILYSASTAIFHAACSKMAAEVPAVVLSVDYRLAPEHRLPAAYEDGLDAIRWAEAQSIYPHPLLRGRADFKRCFLMGSSAGGNIAMRVGLLLEDLKPPAEIKVAGLILNQPYFGGVERTESEKRSDHDKVLPLPANDLMWELALPEGADRDHEYCNAVKAIEGWRRQRKKLPALWMVRGYLGDPLVDRQRKLVEVLRKEGMAVVAKLDGEGFHGIDFLDPSKDEEKVEDVIKFVDGNVSTGVLSGKHKL